VSTVDPLSAVKALAAAWKLSIERAAFRYMVARRLGVADVRNAIATAVKCEPVEGWWQVSGGRTLDGDELDVVICSDFGVVDVQEILGGEGQPDLPADAAREDEERARVADIVFVVSGLKTEERSENGTYFSEETATRFGLLVGVELARLGVATGEVCRFIRQALGFTVTELGETFGRPAEQIARWERDEEPVDRAVWAAMTGMAAERVGEVGDTMERLKAMRAPERPARVELSA
jgi:hypothetical protein